MKKGEPSLAYIKEATKKLKSVKTTMAHPLFIMEQALRQFSSQWYAGFRPSLEIQTKYDGSLVVHPKSFCSNKPSFDWQENSASQFPFS